MVEKGEDDPPLTPALNPGGGCGPHHHVHRRVHIAPGDGPQPLEQPLAVLRPGAKRLLNLGEGCAYHTPLHQGEQEVRAGPWGADGDHAQHLHGPVQVVLQVVLRDQAAETVAHKDDARDTVVGGKRADLGGELARMVRESNVAWCREKAGEGDGMDGHVWAMDPEKPSRHHPTATR